MALSRCQYMQSLPPCDCEFRTCLAQFAQLWYLLRGGIVIPPEPDECGCGTTVNSGYMFGAYNYWVANGCKCTTPDEVGKYGRIQTMYAT